MIYFKARKFWWHSMSIYKCELFNCFSQITFRKFKQRYTYNAGYYSMSQCLEEIEKSEKLFKLRRKNERRSKTTSSK
jgi:hypothetical protein